MTDSWRAQAACRQLDEDERTRLAQFFVDTRNPRSKQVRRAKRICGGCQVQQACLEDRIKFHKEYPNFMPFGVSGGVTPDELKTLMGRVA